MRLSCLHNCATPLPRPVLAGLSEAFFTIAPLSRLAHMSPSGGGLWPPRRLPFQLESLLIRL